MERFTGRARLSLDSVYTFNVVAAVAPADDGAWEARVTPLAPHDAAQLGIGVDTLPGPWLLTYGDVAVPVHVVHVRGKIYKLTKAPHLQ